MSEEKPNHIKMGEQEPPKPEPPPEKAPSKERRDGSPYTVGALFDSMGIRNPPGT